MQTSTQTEGHNVASMMDRMQGSPPPRRPTRRAATVVAGFVTALALLAAAVWGVMAGLDALISPIIKQPACEVTQPSGRTLEYDPEQVQHASTIALLSRRYDHYDRASTVAIATAIQESKLRNLAYGDRDSIGLFQQRPSQGWGTRAQILDPVYSIERFYQALMTVPRWNTLALTDAAQKVQKSGYPNAYAQHEGEATAISAVLTGHRSAGLACRLKEPEKPGNTRTVISDLQRKSGFIATESAHGTLTLTAADSARAWSVGHWAVAHSAKHHIVEVTVGARTWKRSMDDTAMSWSEAASAVAPQAVRIRLHTSQADTS